jgi:hypothetical protein
MKGPAVDGASYERPGSTVHSFAGDLPIAQLPKGDYRVEVQATDSADIGHPPSQSNSDSGESP